ncbi:MAG: hypothetical protein R2827_14455 [Bdellovibrionales bacterium]
MYFRDAEKACEQMKQIYKDSYFFVYCHILEKSQIENHTVLKPKVFEYEYEDWFFYERSYQLDWVPREVSYTNYTYGLRVFGWGDSEFTNWKIVESSLDVAGGLIPLTFDDARSAYRRCANYVIKNSKTNPRYYKAKCRTPKTQDLERYYFQVISKNPMLTAQGETYDSN